MEHEVAQLIEALRLQTGRLRVRFPMVSLEFFIFRSHYSAGVDSVSNRNENQEYLLGGRGGRGGKGGRCVGMENFPPSDVSVLKSGSLNLLETSGPVQTCNGIALPLRILVMEQFECSCVRKNGRNYNE